MAVARVVRLLESREPFCMSGEGIRIMACSGADSRVGRGVAGAQQFYRYGLS